MSLFKTSEKSMAYVKMGLMGEAGSGKSHTATLVMIGLVKHLQAKGIKGSDRPVFMLDTEQGSAWVKPMFDKAGIPLMVAKTRAFKDLVPAVRDAEKNASALLIDSVTHFWEDLQESYKAQRKRNDLQFQDWAVLKKLWRGFSDAFVNSELHCILCGRLGYEYETAEDDRGKKQIEKSGVKMQAEKNLGYEPNMLVWMERNLDLATKGVTRTATILKDRSQTLDGKQFENPTFKTFLPHIEFLSLGGRHEFVDPNRTSEDIIPEEDAPTSDLKSIKRQIVVDEIDALLAEHGLSGQTAEVKTKRAELIKKHFRVVSRTEIERLMPLNDLQIAYDSLHRELTGKASRYGVKEAPSGPVDEIPRFDEAPPALKPPSAPAVEDDDRDIQMHDLRDALKAATTLASVGQVWADFEQTLAGLDQPRAVVAHALHKQATERFKARTKARA